MVQTILLCDDEENSRNLLEYVLSDKGYTVVFARSKLEALSILNTTAIEAIISDTILGGESVLDFPEKLRAENLSIPVIFLTAGGTVQSAVGAMSKGAFSYMIKPANYGDLLNTLERASRSKVIETENAILRKEVSELHGEEEVLTSKSMAMSNILEEARRAALTNKPILITGATGTGKEIFARYIHNTSNCVGLFSTVNCSETDDSVLESELFGYERGAFSGAIRTKVGKVEASDNGTLFLHGVEDLSLPMQAKILRLIESNYIIRPGRIDKTGLSVRVIASTSRDLVKRVEEGEFRSDLYYALSAFPFELPPLSKRREDIPVLAKYFLSKINSQIKKKKVFGEHIFDYFERYDWPGNIRELRNVVERLALLYDKIIIENLPEEILHGAENEDLHKLPLAMLSLKSIEKEAIRQTLIATKGNRRKAAESLEITRQTLYSKIRDYEL